MPEVDVIELPSPTGGLPPPGASLLSNSVAMGMATLLCRGLAYVYVVLLARRLDAKYIGAYAILVTAGMIADLVSNLGLDKLLAREISTRPAAEGQSYFLTALSIRLVMAIGSTALAWGLLLFFFQKELLVSPLEAAVFLSAVLAAAFSRNCEAYLTAHERLLPVALAQLSERVVFFCAILLLLAGFFGFGRLLCFAPLGALARLVVVGWATVQIWTKKLVFQRPHLRALFRDAVELFSVEVLAIVYFRSDVFLVARMAGLRETAYYQVAYKVFDCCLSLFSGFLMASFPRIVKNKSRKALNQMLAFGTALMMAPVAVVILARQQILGALRAEYVAGSTSLVWLMLTVPLVYITSTFANAAVAAGRVKILIFLAFLLLITNVGLNLILIPRYSINGAAFSTFACELMSAAILGPYLLRTLHETSGGDPVKKR
jgi:O-antigen/teichoic acid export membrane protein